MFSVACFLIMLSLYTNSVWIQLGIAYYVSYHFSSGVDSIFSDTQSAHEVGIFWQLITIDLAGVCCTVHCTLRLTSVYICFFNVIRSIHTSSRLLVAVCYCYWLLSRCSLTYYTIGLLADRNGAGSVQVIRTVCINFVDFGSLTLYMSIRTVVVHERSLLSV